MVLASLGDASDLLRLLLNGGHSAKAGYLAGAFRQMGRSAMADEIIGAMKSAGYDVRESNPFEAGQVFGAPAAVAPIVKRIRMLWESTRPARHRDIPESAGTAEGYGRLSSHLSMRFIKSDAYHSLSIEGYSVSPEVIEKVQAGQLEPGRSRR